MTEGTTTATEEPGDGLAGCRSTLGLRIPVDAGRPVLPVQACAGSVADGRG